MRLLWTVGNWKHTGPLEPSLDLAAAVAERGHDVDVAVGRPPRGRTPEAHVCAADRGLRVVNTGASLSKHASPLRDRRDVRRLRRQIADARYDGIVTTLRNDHRLVCRAAGDRPVGRLYFDDGLRAPERRDLAAMRGAAAVFVFAEAAARRLAESGLEAGRVQVVGAPLDLERLRRLAGASRGAAARVRARHGIGDDAFLFGIVARLQRHRRFELLWAAVEELKRRGVRFHLLVLGRGTHEMEVARGPVARLGLGDRVAFAGYVRGRAYAEAMCTVQAQLFLVPGSDPTCRALREGMSLGLPSIATRRGMLPEIVEDGVTGRLVEETPASLAAAMAEIATPDGPARAFGAAARARADARYDARRVAQAVLATLAGDHGAAP